MSTTQSSTSNGNNLFAMPGLRSNNTKKGSYDMLSMSCQQIDETSCASTAFSDIPLSHVKSNSSHIDSQIGYSVEPVALSPANSCSDVVKNRSSKPDGLMMHSKFTIDDDDDDDDGIMQVDTFDNERDGDESNDVEQQSQPLHNSASLSNNHPPPNYRCPLTLQLMEDPVNDGCGHCFERRAIMDWLEYRDVCPISRKPLDYRHDLFTNGSLKMRILEWKEEHPLYQNCDLHYAEHQAAEVLGYHDDDNAELSEAQVQARKRRDPHSQFELMLLPQERQVLSIVKARAVERRKQHDRRNCMRGFIVTLILGIGMLLLLIVLARKLKEGSEAEPLDDGNVNATRF
jgi:hypothetical protein